MVESTVIFLSYVGISECTIHLLNDEVVSNRILHYSSSLDYANKIIKEYRINVKDVYMTYGMSFIFILDDKKPYNSKLFRKCKLNPVPLVDIKTSTILSIIEVYNKGRVLKII